jgi:hypothetical protein
MHPPQAVLSGLRVRGIGILGRDKEADMRTAGRPFVPAIILLSLALFTGQKSGRQIIPQAADFVAIVNEEQPRPPLVDVKFVLDLNLKQPGWQPHSLLVDKGGNLCVFSGKENTLVKFDPAGREIFRKDFKSGQGPGEFGFFDPWFAADGRLVVLDGRQRRVTTFDTSFQLLAVSRIDLWGDIFQLDSASNMYLLVMKFLPTTRDRQLLVLTKCAAEGKPIHEIYEYEWGVRRDSQGIYHSDAYRAQVKFQIDPHDVLWYVVTDRYKINAVSPDGKLSRTISKKGLPRKLTPAEIEGFRPKNPKSRMINDIPDRVAPIADLFLLADGSVLVITFESREGDAGLVGDVFDSQGIFCGRARVPKYDGWDGLLAPRKPAALVSGGFFYTIETPDDGSDAMVKRYKIVMTKAGKRAGTS